MGMFFNMKIYINQLTDTPKSHLYTKNLQKTLSIVRSVEVGTLGLRNLCADPFRAFGFEQWTFDKLWVLEIVRG